MTTVFRLAEVLAEQGMSQAELVRRSGVSQRTVSRLAANDTKQVSLAVLDRLAATLGISPGDLLAYDSPKTRTRHR